MFTFSEVTCNFPYQCLVFKAETKLLNIFFSISTPPSPINLPLGLNHRGASSHSLPSRTHCQLCFLILSCVAGSESGTSPWVSRMWLPCSCSSPARILVKNVSPPLLQAGRLLLVSSARCNGFSSVPWEQFYCSSLYRLRFLFHKGDSGEKWGEVGCEEYFHVYLHSCLWDCPIFPC